MTWAWAQKGLSTAEKLLLMALADHSDDHGVCWPGQAVLREKTELHRSTISALTHRLEERGLLSIESRKHRGVQRSNRYTLKLGIMLIPCRNIRHGDVASDDTAMSPQTTLGNINEPSVEPSHGASAEENMKTFGSGDVEEALKAAVSDESGDPSQHIKAIQKTGSRYTVDALRKIWAILYSHGGYGFLPEWTMKQKGQINQAQKKLGDLPVAAVLTLVLTDWNSFRLLTEAYKPPTKPDVGFLLKHVGAAGEMYLQTLAQPELKQAEPTFVVPQDLTNESESSDNEVEKTPLDWLENLET